MSQSNVPTIHDQMKSFVGESTTVDEKPAKEAAKEAAKETEETAEAVETKEEKPAAEADKKADTDDSGESGADAPEGDADKPKKKKSAEERIAELTAKRREAERAAKDEKARNDALQARLDKLEGKKSDEPLKQENNDTTSELKAPDPNDKKYEYGEFDTQYRADYDKYIRDSARAEAKKELAEAAKKTDETRQAEAAAAKQQELGAKLLEHEKAGIKEYDDFEDALEALGKIDTQIAPETTVMLLESEQAHRILYHLGKNPKEAAEIAAKSPIEQARYLGKLEAKFSVEKTATPEKPKTTKAPDPLTRSRGTNGQFDSDDGTTDFSAFMAKHANKLP